MEIRNFVTVAYFILTIYSFSGGGLLGVVDYPIWKLISAEDFPACHRSYFKRVSILYVPFFFLNVLVKHRTDLDSLSSDVHDVGHDRSGS